MPFFRASDGERLHYLDVGRGPTCVLLHGFGMQAAHYLPFILPLVHKNRFVLIDQRGFGGSRRVPLRDRDFLLSHALDLHDALDELRLDRPALGGISMGAAVSLAYLRRFGFGRVRAYVHMDQAPRVLNDGSYGHGVFGPDQRPILDAWARLGDELEACGRGTPYASIPSRLRVAVRMKLAEFFSYAFHGRLWRASSLLVRSERVAARVLEPENWPLYLDAIRAYSTCDYDFRPSLHRIDVPMHVFVGMESRMYPPEGQIAIQSDVPHAKIVRFARVGHAVPAEAPWRFTRRLGAFLRESIA
jgi:non-heme chloroperoxidase